MPASLWLTLGCVAAATDVPPLPEAKFHTLVKYKDGQAYGRKGANMFELILNAEQVARIMQEFISYGKALEARGGRR